MQFKDAYRFAEARPADTIYHQKVGLFPQPIPRLQISSADLVGDRHGDDLVKLGVNAGARRRCDRRGVSDLARSAGSEVARQNPVATVQILAHGRLRLGRIVSDHGVNDALLISGRIPDTSLWKS